MKHLPILPHFCNEPLRCPACVHRFWVWAENYSSRLERPKGTRAMLRAREFAAQR